MNKKHWNDVSCEELAQMDGGGLADFISCVSKWWNGDYQEPRPGEPGGKCTLGDITIDLGK